MNSEVRTHFPLSRVQKTDSRPLIEFEREGGLQESIDGERSGASRPADSGRRKLCADPGRRGRSLSVGGRRETTDPVRRGGNGRASIKPESVERSSVGWRPLHKLWSGG